MKPLDGVVIDLAPHPFVQFAVVREGQLLPIRFGTEEEAHRHLASVKLGIPLPPVRHSEEAA